MFSTVTSGAVCGITSYLMQVETDVSNGLPMFNMVGLLSTEVREAAERVRVALRNTGIELPPKHITVNFSPADIRKKGVGVDLPVALGILAALGEIDADALRKTLVVGELGLDGEVKRVAGILPVVKKAREEGYETCLLPAECVREGAVIDGMRIVGVGSLSETIAYLQPMDQGERDRLIAPFTMDRTALFQETSAKTKEDFSDINGQRAVRRAVEVAAAGFHHLLMIGAPGAGKSMIAKRIPTILPDLTEEEALEVSTIYSVAGLMKPGEALITKRPFVAPHHTITQTALSGGGHIPQPGAISLAHRGVLFLDEIAEFPHTTLDIMRQPLEDRNVRIARASGTYTYPADFMLVGALNPCPCGYYPDRGRCRCTDKEIDRYLSHLSGPILDRMDLCVEAPRVDVRELEGEPRDNESSAEIRTRILRARERQRQRFRGTQLRFNADMGVAEIRKYCRVGQREKSLLEQIFYKMDLSARAYHRLIKVARTIADLDDSDEIRQNHITEASCYRLADAKYWRRNRE
ncbi:MAG: YifB family Mg chelatase-like AAA ATPase [Lachnospiraceae bacterium]|nr:YifB family Mg chelatase-like AAA ATPase [Lachnospiraceae bacterium]